MIEKIEILDADYSGLGKKLPEGLELDTDSGVVLIVGPNNVGKTALMRMLATSVDFQKHWARKGVSRHLDYAAYPIQESVGEIIEKMRTALEVKAGWFHFEESSGDSKLSKLCQQRGISFDGQVRVIHDRENQYPAIGTLAFDIISAATRDKILKLGEDLKTPTDENIWGFVKPTIAGKGEIFVQPFDLPQDRGVAGDEQHHVRRYTDFQNFDLMPESNKSPGAGTFEKLESFFEQEVADFFRRHKMLKWRKKNHSPMPEYDPRTDPLIPREKRRELSMFDVPKDARLCVLMDEPTHFLDVLNRFRFQEKLMELLGKYKGKLQFVIASNDYALIDGLKGNCVYLNMYEPQATSSRSFDVQQYLRHV